MSKIDYLPEYGLLDSGATHAMRGVCGSDDWQSLEEIQVELAGGEKTLLRMTAGKVIVHEDDRVQPIVPLRGEVEQERGMPIEASGDGGDPGPDERRMPRDGEEGCAGSHQRPGGVGDERERDGEKDE